MQQKSPILDFYYVNDNIFFVTYSADSSFRLTI